jgi:hypothetical protein
MTRFEFDICSYLFYDKRIFRLRVTLIVAAIKHSAKVIDIRTGEKVSGAILDCGRRTRNQEKNGENLRPYRGQKICKGQRRIRTQRYFYQSHTLYMDYFFRFTKIPIFTNRDLFLFGFAIMERVAIANVDGG